MTHLMGKGISVPVRGVVCASDYSTTGISADGILPSDTVDIESNLKSISGNERGVVEPRTFGSHVAAELVHVI
jgi:hypothetical protein